MVRYIDDHKDRFGVEPICAVLPIAPSTYYEQKARERDPDRRPLRAIRDEALKPEVQRVFDENFRVYGAHKVWTQLNREGLRVARCTVERLMKALGLRGVVRGKTFKTTIPDELADRRQDRVNRTFTVSRPNALWVADLTYVATWRGLVFVALVIDAFARRIVGWRVSSSLRSDIALDALEQALYDRRFADGEELIHHSDHGVQYVSIRYTERLAEAGIEPSVGTSATPTTTRSPKRSSASTRPKSFGIKAAGAVSTRSSSRRSHGSTGSTTDDCSSRSATCRRRRRKTSTIGNSSRPWWPDSQPGVSGIRGPVQGVVSTVEMLMVFLCARHIRQEGAMPVQMMVLPEEQRRSGVRYCYGVMIGGQLVPMS